MGAAVVKSNGSEVPRCEIFANIKVGDVIPLMIEGMKWNIVVERTGRKLKYYKFAAVDDTQEVAFTNGKCTLREDGYFMITGHNQKEYAMYDITISDIKDKDGTWVAALKKDNEIFCRLLSSKL